MSGIVCKLFIQLRTENPGGEPYYDLGAVCRGDENKHWAAATPSGSFKTVRHPSLDAVWQAKQSGLIVNPEVLVTIRDGGELDRFRMENCEFAYNGVSVRFRLMDHPYSTLTLTVNNSPATAFLREAYAAGLKRGEPPMMRFDIEAALDTID